METDDDNTLSVAALEEAVQAILSNSFDADSKVCLITLMKILYNILQKPGNDKVRTIRLANPAFSEKVASRQGGVEFLLACGFARQREPPPLLSKTEEEVEERLVLVQEQTSHLVAACRLLLTKAVQDLGIEADELPTFRPPPAPVTVASAPTHSSRSNNNSNTFDPYQHHRFDALSANAGVNLGPTADYSSRTEAQLQSLQKQQEALEKELHGKPLQERDWILTLPGQQQTATATSSKNKKSSAGGGSDASLLAARAKKQAHERQQRETGGLTTKAMRDLAAMKQQKVYSHVTLTIQFADGSRLTGKFLPKEQIATVKSVLTEQCLLPVSNDQPRDFDLYVAPPRRLLEAKQTLQAAGLVPAAKIFASWKVDSAPSKSAPPASYFQDHLLSPPQQQSAGSNASPFPSSQSVAATAAAKPEESQDSKPAAKKKLTPAEKQARREQALLKRMMGGDGNGGGLN